MHRSTIRCVVALTIGTSLIWSLSGCEDSAAKTRDDVQAQLAQIRSDLQNALAKGADSAEAYQQSLNGIVTRLTSLNSGEPGQQAARSLLAADALRQIASVHMGRAADIESRHRADLGVVNARIDAALRLAAAADSVGSIDASARRNELQADMERTRQALDAAKARIAELDGPIGERTTQNQQQMQEVERLRLQVADLLRQAQDQGYSAGFETFKQATQVDRQADKIELEISNREIDLDHELAPEHRMAQMQAARLEMMAQSIETAQSELSAFSTAAEGDAKASRDKAAELAGQVSADLSRLSQEADGELKSAYDDALAALEKAATNAQAAAKGGPETNAAKTVAAGIQESIARVHLTAAGAAADRGNALERVKNSGGVIALAGAADMLAGAREAQKAHTDAAIAAIESAQQALDGVTGAGNEVEHFRNSLQALNSVATGKPVAAPDAGSASATPDQSSATAAVPGGAGAESPEALVEALKSIKGVQDAGRMFDYTLTPSNPQSQSMLNNIRTAIAGMATLDAALQAKFAKGVADMKGDLGGDMPTVAEASIVEQSEASGRITITNTEGQTSELPISKVNDRWYIGSPDDNGAGVMSAIGMGEMAGGGDANLTPEMRQMAMQMMAGMSGMFTAIGQAMNQLAVSVEAGEFATFEDFESQAEARMQQVMQESMGGMMPGLPAGNPNK